MSEVSSGGRKVMNLNIRKETYDALAEAPGISATEQKLLEASQKRKVKEAEREKGRQRNIEIMNAAKELEIELADARDIYVAAATHRDAAKSDCKVARIKAKEIALNVKRKQEAFEIAKLRLQGAIEEQIAIDRQVLDLSNPALDKNLAALKQHLQDLSNRSNAAWGNINPKKRRKALRNNDLRKSVLGCLK